MRWGALETKACSPQRLTYSQKDIYTTNPWIPWLTSGGKQGSPQEDGSPGSRLSDRFSEESQNTCPLASLSSAPQDFSVLTGWLTAVQCISFHGGAALRKARDMKKTNTRGFLATDTVADNYNKCYK